MNKYIQTHTSHMYINKTLQLHEEKKIKNEYLKRLFFFGKWYSECTTKTLRDEIL